MTLYILLALGILILGVGLGYGLHRAIINKQDRITDELCQRPPLKKYIPKKTDTSN